MWIVDIESTSVSVKNKEGRQGTIIFKDLVSIDFFKHCNKKCACDRAISGASSEGKDCFTIELTC